MNVRDEKFEKLISEARSWKMSGWDFSSLDGRWIEEPPPWDFRELIIEEIKTSDSLLDLGTGGGEFLSSLSPLPRHVYCTEGYRPNLPVARDRLKPLRAEVICTYCDDNDVPIQRGYLPFRSESLDLIIDRHESFKASEVYRVLKHGGRFLTQQVGSSNLAELNSLLGSVTEERPGWDLLECKTQIEAAGFEIREAKEAKLKSYFKDVGAVTCFLLGAPWQIEDFTIDGYLPRLEALHEKMESEGGLKVTATRFYAKAAKA
jgi:SAM-dependent methyltransferase